MRSAFMQSLLAATSVLICISPATSFGDDEDHVHFTNTAPGEVNAMPKGFEPATTKVPTDVRQAIGENATRVSSTLQNLQDLLIAARRSQDPAQQNIIRNRIDGEVKALGQEKATLEARRTMTRRLDKIQPTKRW